MFTPQLLLIASFLYPLLSSAATLKRSSALTCSSNGKTTTNLACCVWFDVLNDLQSNLYEGGQCNDAAHQSIMMTFHDAIGFSPALIKQGLPGGGGADGSLMAFPIETTFAENLGTAGIVAAQAPVALSHNVTFGDFIQFAGAVAGSNCPGSPRLKFLTGRPNATQPAPQGLVPKPSDTVSAILSRMADAGFSPAETVALLFAHSVGAQHFIQPDDPGTPFDSTPTFMDTQFYIETLLRGTFIPGGAIEQGEVQAPLAGEFRLQSDFSLARDSRTACTWQSYANNLALVQADYAAASAKLAVLGQPSAVLASLIDCSDVIPPTQLSALSSSGGITVPEGPHFPAGQSLADIQRACATSPFPSLKVDPGPATSVPPVPPF